MNTKKILLLLISLVILVNYDNYMLPDRSELARKITLLQNKIAREKRLNAMKILPEDLNIEAKSLFFDAKTTSYSKAMGELQHIVSDAASNLCNVRNIKWAQMAANEEAYEKLSLDVSLECTPGNFLRFINRLRSKNKLVTIHNLLLGPVPKKSTLIVSFQLHGYRIKDAD